MTIHEDGLTRRTFLAGAGALVASTVAQPAWAPGSGSSLGHWFDDGFGLPAYRYTGPLRFPDSPRYEGAPMLPDDPVFLLGNYRLTLFTHASGLYQLVSGERAWGRLNQGDKPWSGASQATVEIGDKVYKLIGLDEPVAMAAEKCFGVGFGRYRYALGTDVTVERLLSVLPSTKTGDGASAFLVQVRLRNNSAAPRTIRYAESVYARYRQLFADWSPDRTEVAYLANEPMQMSQNMLQVGFTVKPKRLMDFPPAGQMSRLEQFPPSLFVKLITDHVLPYATQEGPGFSSIGARFDTTLLSGEQREFAFVVGYTRDATAPAIDALAARLQPVPSMADAPGSAFGAEWQKVLPAFANEKDPELRREMRWNAAVLEQMATWREYYNETVIPQGTVYDYVWGMMASSRDLAQQALPLCHTNPALARSTLRFLLKRMVPDGEIKLNDSGFGWSPSGAQQTSDQQLYFFLLLAEYLRATGDAKVLSDTIEYYPRDCSGKDTGLAHVRQAFLYLRDRVGVGAHGIVRRWNSDWNDMFFWWPQAGAYNNLFESGECHMNSAMAIVILGDLAQAIDAATFQGLTS